MPDQSLELAELPRRLRAARRTRGLTQAALAAATGVSRVTIARIESGVRQNLRLDTLSRLRRAVRLAPEAVPDEVDAALRARLLARARERERRLDARRRHAALAARLCIMPAREAATAVARARAVVDSWQRTQLCSKHYISRWRAILAGPPKRVAAKLLDYNDWTDALLQNTPWSFALERPTAALD